MGIHLQQTFPHAISPLFTRWFWEAMLNNNMPNYTAMMLNVRTSTKAAEYAGSMSDLGPAQNKTEGKAPVFLNFKEIYTKTFTHTEGGIGVRISKPLIDDDQTGIIRRMPEALMRSCFEKIQADGAALFNYAITTGAWLLPDSVALASHSIPMASGYNDNLGTAGVMTYDTLSDLITLALKYRTYSGSRAGYTAPFDLLVPPDLALQAETLLKSPFYPSKSAAASWANVIGGAEFGGGWINRIIANPYFTSTTAYALMKPGMHRLDFYYREFPAIFSEVHTTEQDVDITAWYRSSFGAWGHDGFFYNNGA